MKNSENERARSPATAGALEKTDAPTVTGREATVNEIPSQFTRDGFAFRLLKRGGDVALFEKRKPSHARESFEVVFLQTHPAHNFFGREYPVRESLPPAEAWGTSGWTYTALEDAHRKFRALAEARQESPFQPAVTPATAFSASGSVNIVEAQP